MEGISVRGGTLVHCDINKDKFMTPMADNLVVLRKKLDLTQAKLSDRVGIDRH